MPGLVPGIHVLTASARAKTWMAGTSPAMTKIANEWQAANSDSVMPGLVPGIDVLTASARTKTWMAGT
jgi:hypothetical protein